MQESLNWSCKFMNFVFKDALLEKSKQKRKRNASLMSDQQLIINTNTEKIITKLGMVLFLNTKYSLKTICFFSNYIYLYKTCFLY